MILGKWMLERGSVMLCGRAGLGKTWASLGIAIACATLTPFLDWRPRGNPKRVLYIDGEMPAEMMQARYQTMLGALTPAQRELALRNIHIISHVDAEGGIPSLGVPWLDRRASQCRYWRNEQLAVNMALHERGIRSLAGAAQSVDCQ
jgi:RecA-family ATPase